MNSIGEPRKLQVAGLGMKTTDVGEDTNDLIAKALAHARAIEQSLTEINAPHTDADSASQQGDQGLGFLLQRFVNDTDGVNYAQTVSADGMFLASSTGTDHARSETFAAIASGLSSLTNGAVDNFGLGTVTRQIIEASNGWILVARISTTATMAVVLDAWADLGMVGYEMTLLSQQLGDVLSPELIDRLKEAGVQAT